MLFSGNSLVSVDLCHNILCHQSSLGRTFAVKREINSRKCYVVYYMIYLVWVAHLTFYLLVTVIVRLFLLYGVFPTKVWKKGRGCFALSSIVLGHLWSLLLNDYLCTLTG